MKIYGMTGGIASGKSTVSNIFRGLGIDIIDADILSRRAVERNSKALRKIAMTFGEEVLLPDGDLNRKKLADIVFEDDGEIEKLNSIVHPEVSRMYFELVEDYKKKGREVVVYDCPLLIEENLMDQVDQVILVITERKLQIERLISRNNFDYDDALKRIQTQMDLNKKIFFSDYIIYNDGDFIQLKNTVINLWNNFLK